MTPSSIRRGVVIASIAALCALAGAGLRQPAAPVQPPAAPAVPRNNGPTRVAIVDATAVLKALSETKDLQARLDTRLADAKKQVEAIDDQIKKLTDDVKLMKDQTSPDARDKQAKLYVLNEQDRALRSALGQLIDEENGASVRSIYLKILDATQAIAMRDHWDIVLRDDRAIVPPEKLKDAQGREHPITGADVTRIADQREILAATGSTDITQDVIDQMNNDYAKRVKQ